MHMCARKLAIVSVLALLCSCDRIGDLPAAPPAGDAGQASSPVCCGCLCKDAHWSCSIETCVDEDGHAVSLGSETGYLEIEQDYPQKADPADSKIRARVWYAFFPADTFSEDKPLAVFFQGGPGASVAVLLGGNTAPRTLDRLRQGGEWVAPNADSWTHFANLLYLESPLTGFSYLPDGQPEVPPDQPPVAFDPDYEAASFVRVLLRFLARHPSLKDSPIILVGESYGGVRATLMLDQILEPDRLSDPAHYYSDPALGRELQEHFSRAFARDSKVWHAEQIARQFGHQVLIQPALLGDRQRELSERLLASEPRCSYVCSDQECQLGVECPDRTPPFLERVAELHEVMRDAAAHSRFLGVDMTSVAWNRAQTRGAGQIYTRSCDPEPELSAVLGPLPTCQVYFKPGFTGRLRGRTPFGDSPDSPIDELALCNLKHVHTFITDAGEDSVVPGVVFVPGLAATPGVSAVRLETRRGIRDIVVTLASDGERRIRFPSYLSSGHSVSLYQPRELKRDVQNWYASTSERKL